MQRRRRRSLGRDGIAVRWRLRGASATTRLAAPCGERRSVLADRLARGRPIEKARELSEVDAGQDFAFRRLCVGFSGKHVSRQATAAPKPNFANAELSIDLQLVEPSGRPD